MAVYKRVYNHYEGNITGEAWRFTILPRYALKTAFESKLITSFFTMCFLPHIIALGLIYVLNNPALMALLPFSGGAVSSFLSIDGNFFDTLMTIESYASFFLIALIGPNLIAPDLANNALPVYLSRPFTRTEYVIGKLVVLVTVSSLLMWIPGLLLIGIQTNLVGFSWLSGNIRIPLGIFFGSWIWILTISITALAISAWVKLKPLAVASLFGVFFVAAGFGNAANDILRLSPRYGTLLNMPLDIRMIWNWFLKGNDVWEPGRRYYRTVIDPGLPAWMGLVAMGVFAVLCLFALARKIRPVEVVR